MSKRKVTQPTQAGSSSSLDYWQREVLQLQVQARLAKHWAERVEKRAARLLASLQRSERR